MSGAVSSTRTGVWFQCSWRCRGVSRGVIVAMRTRVPWCVIVAMVMVVAVVMVVMAVMVVAVPMVVMIACMRPVL
jgi:hypothetical protein